MKKQESENETGNLFLSFESYLLDLCHVFNCLGNKPSIIFLNDIITGETIGDILGDAYFELGEDRACINGKNPFYYLARNDSDFLDVFEKCLVSRNFEDCNDIIRCNDLFVVDRLEECNIKDIVNYITVARSRKIYFIILIEDKELFVKNYSEELYEMIEANCHIKFVCDKDSIVDIQKLSRF